MARPASNGRYVVPKEIEALKPSDTDCFVKVVYSSSKTTGVKKHFYVYMTVYKPDPKYPGRGKPSSGETIGKIEGGKFIPNKTYLKMKTTDSNSEDIPSESQDTGIAGATKEEIASVTQAAVNMRMDLRDMDIQVKDYGEYAIVLASTQSVLKGLEQVFSDSDARTIYALSVIYFIDQYTPASYLKDIYDQSILSIKWPTLAVSENSINDFLHQLGSHPAVCEEYSQYLISESSGITAIDGHVILCCSKQNDLADYGNKYPTLGNKQINLLQAYDVENACSLVSKAYEGGLPDKSSVQDLLTTYDFPRKTCFLIDMGFYSEEDLGLYRNDGKRFIIPVPGNTGISKAMLSNIDFTGSFNYEKINENGLKYQDPILFRLSTVKELEDLYQQMLDEEAERKNQEEAARCQGTGEKPAKHYSRRITRSKYPEDLVILYRDSDMHDKMVAEFASQIGTDSSHTEKKLDELGPQFGIIVLRTNYPKSKEVERQTYCGYKRRWGIETHYNFVENTVHFCGLHESDYTAMQGLAFLTTTFGQVKSAFVKKMRSSSPYVSRMSIKECIVKARKLKLSQHRDKRWYVPVTVKKNAEMLSELGVDIAADVQRLNNNTY